MSNNSVTGVANNSGRKRIALFGSGKGSNARAIIAATLNGTLAARVSVVISDVPGAGILRIASEYSIPTLIIDPGAHRPGHLSKTAHQVILDVLVSNKIDLVACAGFMRILRDPVLDAYAGRILNIHPSLLPKYPGLNAVARAMAAGEKETGCTVHLVDSGVDTGKIIRQERVSILEEDTLESLTARVHAAEHLAYPEAIAEVLAV